MFSLKNYYFIYFFILLPVFLLFSLLFFLIGLWSLYDGSNTFNISTTSSIVISAAGVPVAKHGNRSASSKCGAADVLEELGVNIHISPEKSLSCLKEINLCFLFAQNYHLSMKYVAGVRKELSPFCYVSLPILKAGWNSLQHLNLDMDVMYSMGILVAFGSSVLGTFNIVLDSSFMFYESAVMLPSFLTIGRYLEARAKRKTSSSIKELIGLQPKTATLITSDDDGNSIEKEIDIEDINIGDILLVKPGEKIPADSTRFLNILFFIILF